MTLAGLIGVFALMLVLELPDKTMIATVVMGTRARPLAVASGAAIAFVAQMGIAAAAGGLLTLLPSRPKEFIVAALFLAGAAYLMFVPEKAEQTEGEAEALRERRSNPRREFLTAFGVIFLGEFGDLTQIQAANLVAKTHDPIGIFVASSLALIVIAFVGAYGGRLLLRVIPLAKIRFVGGLVFAGLGLWTLATAIRG